MSDAPKYLVPPEYLVSGELGEMLTETKLPIQWDVPPPSDDIDRAYHDEFAESFEQFLAQAPFSTWGRPWDTTDPAQRAEAADWFATQIDNLDHFMRSQS